VSFVKRCIKLCPYFGEPTILYSISLYVFPEQLIEVLLFNEILFKDSIRIFHELGLHHIFPSLSDCLSPRASRSVLVNTCCSVVLNVLCYAFIIIIICI
jgi:hypothetical protein